MGDESRRTWTKTKSYSSVRMQQGRVSMDADWNEQADIGAWHLQATTRDLVGPSGVRWEDGSAPAFELTVSGSNLLIGAGRIYVDGLMAENFGPPEGSYRVFGGRGSPRLQPFFIEYQPGHVVGGAESLPDGDYLIYVDIWDREVTRLDDALIQEVALGPTDTATRRQRVWQVRLMPIPGGAGADFDCGVEVAAWNALFAPRAEMTAWEEDPPDTTSACQVAPTAGFRGPENQLYRVEIHSGGDETEATFKWSRENASILAALEEIGLDASLNTVLTVDRVGPDTVLGFVPDGWVEIRDDRTVLAAPLPDDVLQPSQLGRLGRVLTVEQDELTMSGTFDTVGTTPLANLESNPQVVRWEGPDGLRPVADALSVGGFELEDGVYIQFGTGRFRAGDHWLVPARTAKGTVEWEEGVFKEPDGTQHHYARLGILRVPAVGAWSVHDCREKFVPGAEQETLVYLGGDTQGYVPGVALDPLRVGVFSGPMPVEHVVVRFTVEGVVGGVTLNGSAGPVDVLTDADGNASVNVVVTNWQHTRVGVVASLVRTSAAVQPMIHFAATRDLELFLGSGDGQVGFPGHRLPTDIRVSVLTSQRVGVPTAALQVVATGGSTATLQEAVAGTWRYAWSLGTSLTSQQNLHLRLVDPNNTSVQLGPYLQLQADFIGLQLMGGDAQHAAVEEILALPLRVGIFSGRDVSPVDNYQIRFTASASAGSLGLTSALTAPSTVQFVSPDSRGIAAVYWRLGGATHPQVTAQLCTGTTPLASAAPIVFHAERSSTTPTSVGVNQVVAGGVAVEVDTIVRVTDVLEGIRVQLDRDPSGLIGEPVIELYAELYQNTRSGLSAVGVDDSVWYRVRLGGSGSVNGASLEWKPGMATAVFLQGAVSNYLGPIESRTRGIRARLYLRGLFRWTVENAKGIGPAAPNQVGNIELSFWIAGPPARDPGLVVGRGDGTVTIREPF